ncbi:hypothetical protein JOF56_001933 [Kibdelosporangium banguiense]|uniref:Uncharacterized protein n=1 Tax=Kibdelosporangium banguiense TaxID=1365924 RepID=A0ABS4TCG2_9PSEU|nr:hypothetical protein [Kibdelosporangium banguiense]MBP2321548.1 hypothetical protein [Kibdelosporangium banguiense]
MPSLNLTLDLNLNPPGEPLDLATVVAVLYVSPFTEVDYRQMPTAALAAYVTTVAADPRFRVAELVALVADARRAGLCRAEARHLADAERHAPRVLSALTH